MGKGHHNPPIMKPVIQKDQTGCGLACVATVSGVSYQEVKKVAAQLGIEVQDSRLWSDTKYVRTPPQTLQHRNISSHTVISLLGCPPPAGLIGYQMAHHKGSRFLALDRVLARLKRTGGAGPQSISEKQYPHRFWANAPEMVYDHPSRRPGSH